MPEFLKFFLENISEEQKLELLDWLDIEGPEGIEDEIYGLLSGQLDI